MKAKSKTYKLEARLYTRKQLQEKLQKTFTQAVHDLLNDNYLIENYSNHGIRFKHEKLSDVTLTMNENSVIKYKWWSDGMEKEVLSEYVSLGGRNKVWTTRDDYLYFIKPLQESRAERKQARSDYRIVKHIPDSMIERLREYDGFKKVNKDNLKILRYDKKLIVSCGTKAVLMYNFSHWSTKKYNLEKAWQDSDRFEYSYNNARKEI